VRTALIVLVSLAVLGLAEGAFHGLRFLSDRRGRELRRRLESTGKPIAIDSLVLRQGRFSAIPTLDAWLSERPWARRVEHLLEQADSRMTVVQFLGFTALGLLAGALSGFWAGAFAVIIAVGAGAAPLALLRAAREKRSRRLSAQLPEALDMISRSLRAGHALGSAFQLVASEMQEPISVEFARAREEQQLGMSLARAVREMAARSPSNADLKIFAVSTVIQAETGGNLAEILDGIARTVRERFQLFGKVRSLTAEARLSAWFVGLMPLLLAAILMAMQPTYVARLVDNGLGRSVLAFGIVSWMAGIVWFHRLTRFEF
jgi:tight adherence protein B